MGPRRGSPTDAPAAHGLHGSPFVTVYSLNPLADRRWAGFVQRQPLASVFHTTGWLEALHRTYGYEPIAYTTSAPAADLTNAVVLCRVSSWLTGRRMVSLPFADHCEPLVERLEDREAIFSALQARSKTAKWSVGTSAKFGHQHRASLARVRSLLSAHARPPAFPSELFWRFARTASMEDTPRRARSAVLRRGGRRSSWTSSSPRLRRHGAAAAD
jgi:hypothetical protein